MLQTNHFLLLESIKLLGHQFKNNHINTLNRKLMGLLQKVKKNTELLLFSPKHICHSQFFLKPFYPFLEIPLTLNEHKNFNQFLIK